MHLNATVNRLSIVRTRFTFLDNVKAKIYTVGINTTGNQFSQHDRKIRRGTKNFTPNREHCHFFVFSIFYICYFAFLSLGSLTKNKKKRAAQISK